MRKMTIAEYMDEIERLRCEITGTPYVRPSSLLDGEWRTILGI